MPDDHAAGRRITAAGKIAAEHGDLQQIVGEGSPLKPPPGASLRGEIGLVTEILPDAEFDEAVERYVQGLLTRPARSSQWSKMAVDSHVKQIGWPAIENGLNLLEISNISQDHRRLVDEFEERKRAAKLRKPE